MSAPTPPNQPPGQGRPPTGNPPPPTGPPTPSASSPVPPPRNPAEDDAAVSNRKQLTGFKIATAALAVLCVLLIIFAFTLNKRYNDAQESSQQQISALQTQINTLQTEEGKVLTADANKIADLESEIQKLKGDLKVDEKALKSDDRQLVKAHEQYTKLQAKADKEEATLNDKLKAAQAEAALAKHCASIAYSGLSRAYEDFDYENVREVSRLLNEATDECKSVVSTYAG